MVKVIFYEEEQTLDQIPEAYYEFTQTIGAFFGIEEAEKLILEYTTDNKTYILLNNENYNDLFLNGNNNTIVYVYSSLEESNAFKNKKEESEKIEEKEEKIEEKEEEDEDEEEINSDKNEYKIKIPEITSDMVKASIIKQVKENMQRSRLLMLEKQKKEDEERKKREREEKEKKVKEEEQKKQISNQINNLISNRLDNLKEELINESQIKMSEIISESQLNLQNIIENNIISEENVEKIHSLEEHPGIKCTKCGMSPIVGNRYCCVFCKDVNYCENCEEKNGLIHGHPMYKFKLRIDLIHN